MWLLGQVLIAVIFVGILIGLEWTFYRRVGKDLWAERKHQRILEYRQGYLKVLICAVIGWLGVWGWFIAEIPGPGVGYALWFMAEMILLFVGYRYVQRTTRPYPLQ